MALFHLTMAAMAIGMAGAAVDALQTRGPGAFIAILIWWEMLAQVVSIWRKS